MTRPPLSLPEHPDLLPLITAGGASEDPFIRLRARDARLEEGGLSREVACALRRLHAQYRAVTLVAPSPHTLPQAKIFSHSSVRRRIRRNVFYLLDESGSLLFEADPAAQTVAFLGGHDRTVLRHGAEDAERRGEPGHRCDAAFAARPTAPCAGWKRQFS